MEFRCRLLFGHEGENFPWQNENSEIMFSASVCSGKLSLWGAGWMREHQEKLSAVMPRLVSVSLPQ
jgi:hypothetical protein